ncbi:unnamed protein product [marine sediment metagenome]|uniref:Uncharacterized protein n=1 Tax=marine sediment metagenome TaxID=412755 RepID=X1S5J8_9ZZZZ
MKKTITLLTILMLVVFMVGCENSMNPIEPQTQNDNDGISLAKKTKPDKPDKPGESKQEATFNVTFAGKISGSKGWTQEISSGTKTIRTRWQENIELDLSGLETCIAAPVFGILNISKAKKSGDASSMFWFSYDGIDHQLKMYGDFDGQWLPEVDGENTITLNTWEIYAHYNKDNDEACTDEGFFGEGTTLKVVRSAP